MNELLNELLLIAKREDIYDENLKLELTILLGNYEISEKSTDIVLYNNDDYNRKMTEKFLIDKMVSGCTERTIKHYKETMRFILERINKPVNVMSGDDIKLYLAIRQGKDKISDTTASNEWHVLSSFYNWAYKEELIEKNPMNKVECPKKRKKKKKAFSNMECEVLRSNCKDLREKAIVEILFSTWCRVSEVEQMNISDIEGDSMTVIGKGQKERIVYLNSKAQLAIKYYLETRKDYKDELFVSVDKPFERLKASQIEKTIRDLGKRAGVENTHPHRFRRTGATMALRSGMPIEKVSYLLGHESINTTQIYLDISEEEIKQAHKKWVN